MSVKMHTFPTREAWLEARKNYIGGSDASAVVGMNPYKSNVDLWLEKTGQVIPEDISHKPYVQYGHDAEYHLRELFRLDFPEYQVFYEEDNMFTNEKYPWGHFSADGWLQDANGRKGILEIKTTEILQSMQKEKWNHKIPDNYYIQILHGFLIMEAEFAILKAQLKTVFDGVPYLQTRHYFIERQEVEEDIKFLESSERRFWHDVQKKIRPALILPEF